MARYIWCRERMAFVPPHEVVRQPVARSALAAPHIVGDTMQHLQHPATGEYFDSKAAFRRRTKEMGCVELGTDATAEPPKPVLPDRKAMKAGRVSAIKQAMRSQGVDVL